MSDPLTPFLNLTKPVVNDEAGEDLWGDKLNRNFDLIDDFAASQGVLTEAPEDGKYYLRGERQWTEGTLRTDFNTLGQAVAANDADIAVIVDKNTQQDTAIGTKAPLGPSDGNVYGWKGTDWFLLSGSGGSFTITWDQVTNKPATYPPTLPIPSSGVTGLDAKQSAQDDRMTTIEGVNTSQATAISNNATALSTETTNRQNADANLQTQINGKEPTIAAGTATYVWYGNKTWGPLPPGGIYVQDTPPAGVPDNALWWSSDEGVLSLKFNDGNTQQWVAVSAAGMGDVPADGFTYLRQNQSWQSGGKLKSNLTIESSNFPYFHANTTDASKSAGFAFDVSGVSRWLMLMAGSGGSYNWQLQRYNASGTYVDSPIVADAGNGSVTIPQLGGTSINITGNLTAGGQATITSGLAANFVTSYTGVNVANAGAYVAIQNGYASFVNNWSSSYYGIQCSGTAQLGGGLFYGAGNGYYCILGYGGYNVWTNSTAHILGNAEVRAQDYVRSMGQTAILVGHPTTTAAATGYLNTGGTVYRSTSSIAFKTAVEPMQDEFADKVLQLEPIFYRPGPMTADPQDWSRFGLSAEQANAVDFRFAITDRKVERDAKGKAKFATKPGKQPNPDHLAWLRLPKEEQDATPMPEPEIHWDEPTGDAVFLDGDEIANIDLNGIVAALISVVKRQSARIQTLETRLGL